MTTKIGIIKEEKTPIDRRVALTPAQAKGVMQQFADVQVVVQTSDIRCFQDADYTKEGVRVVEQLDDCDVLLGVKEVPIARLIPNKTYFFFSHTIKKQAYNRELLRAILSKNIRLIDYEALTDVHQQRIVAFGRYAGLVGAYNALWAFGRRYHTFDLKRVHKCFDLEEVKSECDKASLPPIKIALTGGGRAAKGTMELLTMAGVRKVTPERFIKEDFPEPVYTQLNSRDYHLHQSGKPFNRAEFFEHPKRFVSDFHPYARSADMLVACAFWHPDAPVLFTREEAIRRDFNINIIADVTCDIQGSIPSTLRATTIEDPVYDYDPTQGKEQPPFSNEGNITVMAVDNLPCELPRDASEDFGKELMNQVLPCLLGNDPDGIMNRATIAERGRLTPAYEYLQDYVRGQAPPVLLDTSIGHQ